MTTKKRSGYAPVLSDLSEQSSTAPKKTEPKPTGRAPTILEFADAAVERSKGGVKPLTRHWRAVLAAFYGLPLEDWMIDILCKVTSARGRINGHRPKKPPELPIVRARSRAYWEKRRHGAKPFRQLIARIGRRGRKSWTIGLVNNYEALYGDHQRWAPKGQTLVVPMLSTQIATTTGVKDALTLYADALGIKWITVRLDGNREAIKFVNRPYAFTLMPCKPSSTRGFSSPLLVLDEFAHVDDEEGVNSDVEILRAAKPAMLQFKSSKTFMISSPMGNTGEFALRCDANLGDDGDEKYRHEDRILAVSGPSWEFGIDDPEEFERFGLDMSLLTDAEYIYDEANTEEPDDEAFWREYGAIPSGSEGVAFFTPHVTAAFERKEGVWRWGRPVMWIDSAGGGTTSKNSWACTVGVCGMPTDEQLALKTISPDGTPVVRRDDDGMVLYEARATKQAIRLIDVFGWNADEINELGIDEVLKRLAAEARNHNCEYVFGDQYGAPFIEALLIPHAIRYRHFHHSAPSKHEAVLTIRWLIREGRLQLPKHDQLEKDLKSYPSKITGGRFTYGRDIKKGHHHDFASSVMTMAHSLNGISLGGGLIGYDQRGADYRIQFAPTRVGVGKIDIPMPNNVIPMEQQLRNLPPSAMGA